MLPNKGMRLIAVHETRLDAQPALKQLGAIE